MEKMIAGIIFTFLLFSVSTIASDPTVITASDAVHKFPTEPTTVEELRSEAVELTVNDKLPESEQTEQSDQTQTLVVRTIDPLPRQIFARSLPIQRHSFDANTRIPLRFVRRHPCRKFKKMFPAKMPYGNDMIISDKVNTVDLKLEEINDPIPMKWLEFKHKYGHRHHHHHHDKDEKFEYYNGEKKKEHKGGFMRRVRKFLKHTFD